MVYRKSASKKSSQLTSLAVAGIPPTVVMLYNTDSDNIQK